jgi:hypothetical protein
MTYTAPLPTAVLPYVQTIKLHYNGSTSHNISTCSALQYDKLLLSFPKIRSKPTAFVFQQIAAINTYQWTQFSLRTTDRHADVFQSHSSTSPGSNLSPYTVTNARAVNTEHSWRLTEIGMENATKAQLSIGHTRSGRTFTDYPKREHRGIIVKMENIRKHK